MYPFIQEESVGHGPLQTLPQSARPQGSSDLEEPLLQLELEVQQSAAKHSYINYDEELDWLQLEMEVELDLPPKRSANNCPLFLSTKQNNIASAGNCSLIGDASLVTSCSVEINSCTTASVLTLSRSLCL